MKNNLIIFILFSCLIISQIVCGAQKVSQFGIEWVFDKDYQTGQFANGDNWVVGPVTIVGMTPASVEVDGRVMNGSMLNPTPKLGKVQGYDSRMFGSFYKKRYIPDLNAARPGQKDLGPSNTLVVQPGSSLISSVSISKVKSRPQLKTAAILTVLSAPARAGSFRPAYCGTDKTIKFNKNMLKYSLLKKLKPVPGVPDLAQVEQYFERPWIDHIPGWLGRYHHPHENMPDYGREIACNVGIGALMLNLNFPTEQKENLLISYVQLGIDLYGVVQTGGGWGADGGHGSGRKFPILFAGMLLDDINMKNIGRIDVAGYGPSSENYVHFGEDDQTFYVGPDDIFKKPYPKTNYKGFVYYGHGNGAKKRDYLEYNDSHKGLPEWGITHAKKRDWDGLDWDALYRRCCTANSWAGFVLVAHMMDAKRLWNHDALFDYMDRYMEVEFQYGHRGHWMRQWSRFTENMWDHYRPKYGSVWTLSPKLKVSAENGVITNSSDKSVFKLAEEVTLKAVANDGYVFAGWEGDLMGNDNPIKIVMYSNRSIAAKFEIKK